MCCGPRRNEQKKFHHSSASWLQTHSDSLEPATLPSKPWGTSPLNWKLKCTLSSWSCLCQMLCHSHRTSEHLCPKIAFGFHPQTLKHLSYYLVPTHNPKTRQRLFHVDNHKDCANILIFCSNGLTEVTLHLLFPSENLGKSWLEESSLGQGDGPAGESFLPSQQTWVWHPGSKRWTGRTALTSNARHGTHPSHNMYRKQTKPLGLERWLSDKDHWQLSRGPGFDSQHLHGISQPCSRESSSGQACYRHTCRQNTQVYEINK